MDDIADIKNLSEQKVLQMLRERFKSNKIYTFAGDILIKIAPVNDVKCHSLKTSERYLNSKRRELPAHLYAVANDAYQGIQAENQCIILRGQSGSGKTEATNRILRHYVVTNCETNLQEKILQVPVVLEAFGNAKTALNANSSRFGKYTALYFSEGKVVGLKMTEFLLERWRLINHTDEETNFHVFYYLLAGQGLGQRMAEHRYLGNNQIVNAANISMWQEKCEELTAALSIIGFSNQEQADINLLLLSILALGNVTVQRSRVGEAMLDQSAMEKLKSISEFLGLNSADLEESICCCDVTVNGEKVQKRLTRDEAEDSRDVLACFIYQRLFLWIVYRMNCLLRPLWSEIPPSEIGLLDMPGFENDHSQNSLEQCLINLTEEILVGLFCETAFRVTEEQCQIEGVTWPNSDVPSNDDIADLFLMKPGGILATLDEATSGDTGTDENFIGLLANNLKNNQFFEKGTASAKHLFTVKHFMEKVTYDARGWIGMNKNTLSSATVLMFQNAENSLLSTMFKANISSRGTITSNRRGQSQRQRNQPVPASRALTTTTCFKNSIQAFLTKIQDTNRHFVCCIKPSKINKEPTFDDQFVSAQLKWLGVIEAARVYSDGFSVSIEQQQFLDNYGISVENGKSSEESPAAICRSILNNSGLTGWQIGKSKVFLRGSHLRTLSQPPKQPTGEDPESKSTYCLAQQVTPIITAPVPRLNCPSTPSYTQVTPKVLRGDGKNLKGRLYPSLDGIDKNANSDHSDSDFEQLGEDFMNTRRKELENCSYGEVGTRQAAVRWFKMTQANALRQEKGKDYYEWCHGIITRKESEELLSNKPRGCFLVRLGETRFGYTLSFKDDNRCRHYMIEQLMDGRYKVVGEPKDHKTLCDLVNFYKKNKLANWNGVLTVACGQRDGDCDYLELMLSSEEEEQLSKLMNTARLEPTAPDYFTSGSNFPRPGPGIIPPKMPVSSSHFYVNTPSNGGGPPRLPPPRIPAHASPHASPRAPPLQQRQGKR